MEQYNGFVTLLNIKYPKFKYIGFYCIIYIGAVCAKCKCNALDKLILQKTKLINFIKKQYLLYCKLVKFLTQFIQNTQMFFIIFKLAGKQRINSK